ncbi:hypothetical protein HY30_04420 [Hyphomonas chukchiensis]|uniref:Uncharacterized protein n=1 Tax=Hyphomonas chukchiensis TaxID=1280947 RepID=A0A062UI74_9PROT|nr:hypothetical protein HY30_04420 [Hyphomonas chukchiensis]
MDNDAQMPTITPGNLIFEKLLLHWLAANKARKFQNALSDTVFRTACISAWNSRDDPLRLNRTRKTVLKDEWR